MPRGSIQSRVAVLESEVARLRTRLEAAERLGEPWWEQIAGTFANDAMYKEAMRLGRVYRESLRPGPPKRSSRARVRARH